MMNWGLTRNEKFVLLFLVGFFFVGTGIKVFRRHLGHYPAEKKQQIAHLDSLKERFMKRAEILQRHDSSSIMALVDQSVTGSNQLININNATIEELIKLPRIGPVLARRIVKYRQQNGKFQHKEDICGVKGIGKITYQKIKPFITTN